MSDILNTIDNLPDISFIDGLTLENIQSQMLSDFVAKYQELRPAYIPGLAEHRQGRKDEFS